MLLCDFAVLTLDCYGTLIDRDTGIVTALLPWLHDAGITASRGEILRAFVEAERAQLALDPGRPYGEILTEVHHAIAEFFGVSSDQAAAAVFAASIKDWPAYSDSPGALAYLKEHYRLVILANVDRASFAHAAKKLGVAFDAVFTAEEIGGLKPSEGSFGHLLGRLEAEKMTKERILHVAGSLRDDHVPAKQQGLRTCWIERRQSGAARQQRRSIVQEVEPDFHFDSLGAMTDAHWSEVGST